MLLALGAALAWGVSDFLGGVTSRRLPLLSVLLITQIVGLAVVLPFAIAHAPFALTSTALLAAALGSLFGLVGIAGLYRAIALGVGSIAAPISASGAALPVAFGMIRGEPTPPLQVLGMLLALLGVVIASRSGNQQAPVAANGVTFALLAALGFGGFFILLHEASSQDVLWAVSVQRATGALVLAMMVLAHKQNLAVKTTDTPRLFLVGSLDQTANVLYGLASTVGLVSLSAVLASLYPLVTVILARLVLNERISTTQKSGVAIAVTGVALLAGR
jgi:drug/metabolite transporter (DMT)-like permease